MQSEINNYYKSKTVFQDFINWIKEFLNESFGNIALFFGSQRNLKFL